MENDTLNSENLQKIKSGDSEAFEVLFRACFQPLVNFIYRFVKDIEIAENLTQEIFLAIWKNRTGINPDLDFKIYLFRAARNKALNHLKKQKIENHLRLEIDLHSRRPKTPYDDLNEAELSEAIATGVENLPDKCRLIFAMNRFDGLTYKEISETLNISIKTVETQMGRALKSLRKSLIHCFEPMIRH